MIMDMIQKIIRRSMRDLEPMKTLKKMCDAMHEEGIQVILDGVFNHVGREFFAFEDVREEMGFSI